ncbi:hypothetical protein SDC9_159238 [bioreactor metagenome]|uniref:Uncharacterized protein n=1 Tax=bioreactor metagenome TaxID=1076179 RepID=A0A645FF06_9ZZZZ
MHQQPQTAFPGNYYVYGRLCRMDAAASRRERRIAFLGGDHLQGWLHQSENRQLSELEKEQFLQLGIRMGKLLRRFL